MAKVINLCLARKLHRLIDRPTSSECDSLGVKHYFLRGAMTGEFRCPKKGEWYLSGALPAAYKARNDMESPYYILRLVVVSGG